jgi:hypothetical protein
MPEINLHPSIERQRRVNRIRQALEDEMVAGDSWQARAERVRRASRAETAKTYRELGIDPDDVEADRQFQAMRDRSRQTIATQRNEAADYTGEGRRRGNLRSEDRGTPERRTQMRHSGRAADLVSDNSSILKRAARGAGIAGLALGGATVAAEAAFGDEPVRSKARQILQDSAVFGGIGVGAKAAAKYGGRVLGGAARGAMSALPWVAGPAMGAMGAYNAYSIADESQKALDYQEDAEREWEAMERDYGDIADATRTRHRRRAQQEGAARVDRLSKRIGLFGG